LGKTKDDDGQVRKVNIEVNIKSIIYIISVKNTTLKGISKKQFNVKTRKKKWSKKKKEKNV